MAYTVDITGISDDDIRSFLEDYGVDITEGIDATKLETIKADRDKVATTGPSKFLNTLDTILAYVDKGLTIASKNGLIGKNDFAIMFPSLAGLKAKADTEVKDDTTNNAPPANNRIFGIDFTDPKVLIIALFVILTIFYFLFFNKKETKKSR